MYVQYVYVNSILYVKEVYVFACVSMYNCKMVGCIIPIAVGRDEKLFLEGWSLGLDETRINDFVMFAPDCNAG